MPDAHDPSKRHAPMMLTTDLALRMDPIYAPITKRFHENPDQLADAFAQGVVQAAAPRHGPALALPRPVGRPSRSCGRTRCPPSITTLIGDADIAALKAKILESGLSVSQLVSTAWASAASFRGTDKRGGANGARIRLAPQKELGGQRTGRAGEGAAGAREGPAGLQRSQSGGKTVSLADVIVLGGCAAVEKAAKDAGHDVTVPFAPGRTDASQEQTDVESFAVLEPAADGFRNYLRAGEKLPPEQRLLDGPTCSTLTAPEMTVLVGGLRALGANHGGSRRTASSPTGPGR